LYTDEKWALTNVTHDFMLPSRAPTSRLDAALVGFDGTPNFELAVS
jgi:hypothetical protein